MSHDEFTKLFKYMTKRFDELDAKIDTKADKSQVDAIYALLDAESKRHETDEQERLIMGHQIDRHKVWINRLADKTNTKLAPEL